MWGLEVLLRLKSLFLIVVLVRCGQIDGFLIEKFCCVCQRIERSEIVVARAVLHKVLIVNTKKGSVDLQLYLIRNVAPTSPAFASVTGAESEIVIEVFRVVFDELFQRGLIDRHIVWQNLSPNGIFQTYLIQHQWLLVEAPRVLLRGERVHLIKLFQFFSVSADLNNSLPRLPRLLRWRPEVARLLTVIGSLRLDALRAVRIAVIVRTHQLSIFRLKNLSHRISVHCNYQSTIFITTEIQNSILTCEAREIFDSVQQDHELIYIRGTVCRGEQKSQIQALIKNIHPKEISTIFHENVKSYALQFFGIVSSFLIHQLCS